MSNRRSGGGFGNNRGNRFDNNQGRVAVQNRGGGNNYGQQQQQQGWRQQNMQMQNQRQSGGPQGGGMNSFGNQQYQQQQHQQQQMMNSNQFANAVLRSSVGPNPGMMSSFGGGNQDQPVVMVLPQSQATGGMMGNMGGGMGNMGGNMGSQNPFAAAVMNQQKPMQVIVGNLPGLNPAAFGQQVLPAYGQGVGEQNMGMFGQQNQQGSNRFNNNKMSADRGRNQNQRNQKTLVRRNEANDRGRLAAPRGVAKKRGPVGQQQYGDLKKPRTAGLVNRNRPALAIRKDRLKNRRANKLAGNKAAAKTDAKKDGDEAKDKPAENGNAESGENKEGTAAEGGAPEEKKPSKFDEIPVELLVCKVCQKAMSDGQSYESHLTGKAHVNLMKIVEEKFSKRAELLMCESKMCEEEIAVEKDRQRRQGKGGKVKSNQNHCKMCDCNYTVNWGAHKASVWHRVLKEFLHPNCRFCKSQFVHRKDWVEHILSIGHLKKLVELKAEGKISVTDQETTSQEELFAVHIEMTKDEKPLNVVNIHYLGGRQPLTDDIKEMLQGENGEIVLPEGEITIPDTFDENAGIGQDAILVVGGTCCKVCRIYIPEGGDEAHCKSRRHFDSYVEYLKRVIKLREQKAAAEKKALEEAEKKAKAEAEAAAKAAEAAQKAAEAAKVAEAAANAAATGVKPAAASPSKPVEGEKMEVDQSVSTSQANAASSPSKPANDQEAVAEDQQEENADEEQMEDDQAETEKAAVTPTKAEAAKPAAASPNKTPQQRGGQNNRGARGSPARGRGAPNRGGGGFNRGGRGGQNTPARGNATPVRGGGRGAQARGGNRGGGPRGSPGRGRGGRGGW